MGIYWVYFKTHHGCNEMRLQVEAPTRDEAISIAQKKADTMKFGWKQFDIQVCR